MRGRYEGVVQLWCKCCCTAPSKMLNLRNLRHIRYQFLRRGGMARWPGGAPVVLTVLLTVAKGITNISKRCEERSLKFYFLVLTNPLIAQVLTSRAIQVWTSRVHRKEICDWSMDLIAQKDGLTYAAIKYGALSVIRIQKVK